MTAPAATETIDTGSTIGRTTVPTSLFSDSTKAKITATESAMTAITQ